MDLPYPKEAIVSPVHLLSFYDEDIQSGRLKLEGWQKELLVYFAKEHKYLDKALEAMLLAANGSGKSQFIIAPLVIWFMMRFVEAQAMITNASGAQLNSGNLRHSTRLAERINNVHKEQIFDCQFRKITNKITSSVCDMFATDEPGKVEGKHPLRFDGKFLIVVDEGKSVADEIFDALLRSHDYTHKLVVSSSGTTSGTFYRDWHNQELNNNVFKKRVTVYDCPHIPKSVVDEMIMRKGRNDPLIRSMFFSEFTSCEDNVVITRDNLLKCAGACDKWFTFGPIRGGLDLAAGGDESAISIWNGNKEIASQQFDNKDTSKTVVEVIDFVNSIKGLKPENIYADDGGVGRGILDNFREKGYNFRRVLNNQKPWDTTRYVNRGTELWFNFKRFVEECQVLFKLDSKGNIDPVLLDQLANRYYKVQDASGKIILESKQKAKAEGHPSPDRADATVLAWSPYVYPLSEMTEKPPAEKRGLSAGELDNQLRDIDRQKLFPPKDELKEVASRLTEQQLVNNFTYRHKTIYTQNSNRRFTKRYS